MAQLNRSISFVAVAVAVAVAAVAAVASLDGLAAASRDYRSLGLFLKFFFVLQTPKSLLFLFSHVCPEDTVLAQNSISGNGSQKNIFSLQKIIFFFVGVFW